MSNEIDSEEKRKTVAIAPTSHQKAVIASGFRRQSMNDFVSEAIDRLADPVLKKHGVKPESLEAA